MYVQFILGVPVFAFVPQATPGKLNLYLCRQKLKLSKSTQYRIQNPGFAKLRRTS